MASSDGIAWAAGISDGALQYVAAGADCIFVPGVVEAETIRRLDGAISYAELQRRFGA